MAEREKCVSVRVRVCLYVVLWPDLKFDTTTVGPF